MSYALTTLWHERQRYLPGVLAVAFSALLIALQCGLLLGLFSITSMPIDHTNADIWMGAPAVLSVDLGEPIRAENLFRLEGQPGVERARSTCRASPTGPSRPAARTVHGRRLAAGERLAGSRPGTDAADCGAC